jgi:hypothetical protein
MLQFPRAKKTSHPMLQNIILEDSLDANGGKSRIMEWEAPQDIADVFGKAEIGLDVRVCVV